MVLSARRILTIIAAVLALIFTLGVVLLHWIFLLLLVPLLVVGAVTVVRPWWGILSFAAFLPFNGVTTDLLVTAGEANAALLVGAGKDVVLAGLVVAAFTTGRFRMIRRDLLIIVGALLLIGALAAVWTPSLAQAAYGWRNNFEPMLLLLVVPLFVTEQLSRRIVLALAIAAQAASLVALMTWGFGRSWLYTTGRLPVAEGQRYPGTLFVHDSELPRAFSPFSGPNELAVAMAIAVAVILCQSRWKWWVRGLLSVAPIVAVMVAQSRSGQLGVVAVAVAVAAWVLWQRSKVLAIVFSSVAAVAGTVGAIYYAGLNQGEDADPSLGGHASSLSEAIGMIIARPLGYGLGQVGPRAVRFIPDPIKVESFWLLLALEAGILALVLFVVLLGRLVHISLRAQTLAAFSITAAIAASLVSQLVLPTLQDTSVAYLLWLIVGLGLYAAGHLRPIASAQVAAETVEPRI